MKLSEIKTATDSQLLKAQADAMNSQGHGVNFSQMLENKINKIQIEIDKRKFNEYLNQDSHYFSESHLHGWFKTEYHGKTKKDIIYKLKESHDNSLEIEDCEIEIGRDITEEEAAKLLKKFYKSVIENIDFKRGVAIGFYDSRNMFNY